MLNTDKKNEKGSIATRLRSLRVNAGYTQQNMADALNINRSTYTYYETGKTTPDIGTIQRLSRILNVEIEDFLNEELTNKLESPDGRRPTKIPKKDPEKIGDLSSMEKSIVAVFRNEGLTEEELEKILQQLKNK